MENQNNDVPTFLEASKQENYDFHKGMHPYYKGKMMSKKQIAQHIKVLRGMIIDGNSYMYQTLKIMLLNAIKHPTPWKKPHVYE